MHLKVGTLILEGHKLYRDQQAEPRILTPKEARLLALLMQNPNRVVSRAEIMKQVWETDYLEDTRTLDVHVCWLRQKLEVDPSNPRLIITRRGRGYMLHVSA